MVEIILNFSHPCLHNPIPDPSLHNEIPNQSLADQFIRNKENIQSFHPAQYHNGFQKEIMSDNQMMIENPINLNLII